MKVFVFLSILSVCFLVHCTPKVHSSTTQTETLTTEQNTPDESKSEPEPEPEPEMVEVPLITDVLGFDKKITVRVKKEEGVLKPLKFNDPTRYYIGILNYNLSMTPQSSLKLLNWEVPMTPISMIESRSPSPVVISEFDVGKLAIVHGYSDGGMMYLSNIVAVFKQEPMALLMELLNEEGFDLEKHVRKN